MMFRNGCQHAVCPGSSSVTNWKIEAWCLHVSWECSNGHMGCWTSSQLLCNKNGTDIYANSFLLAAGLLITGNNFNKLSLFCKFLGLGFICRSTYNRLQSNYLIPEINSYGNMWHIKWGVYSTVWRWENGFTRVQCEILCICFDGTVCGIYCGYLGC